LNELNKYLFKFDESEFCDTNTKEKITSYKYIIEPIITNINSWLDFRKFRNNVLAHNLRIDLNNFKSVLVSNELHKYNAPESTVDLLTLFEFSHSITKITNEMFLIEYQEAKAIIDGFDNPKKCLTTPEDGQNRVANVLAEVNKRIYEYNERIKNLKQST